MRWQDVYARFGNDRQSGFGLHDSPNKYLNPPDVAAHARTLKRYGIDNYKMLADADNKKAGRVQIYRTHGIHSIVRTHVDRPTPNYVIDIQVARDYVNAGAWAIEPMNEPNLKDEWADGTFPGSWSEYGRIVARQWLRNAELIVSAGGVPVTPALSPGGHVPHREATLRFLDGINFHGGRALLDRAVIGVHWRPLNNPIDTPPNMGNPPNTTLWREYEWFYSTYSAYLGYMPGFVETESGYSPGSSENGTFPPMTAQTWAGFNRELYSRLNPSHPKATGGQVICQDYWIEGTDGSGVWRIDAAFINWMEENQPPDEPLWGKEIRSMGINWDRKVLVGATMPPPTNPPVEPPPTPPGGPINLPAWVAVQRASVPVGGRYWHLKRAWWQDGNQSGGTHHIYVTEPHNAAAQMVATIEDTNVTIRAALDKPQTEPAGNIAMSGGGNRYRVGLESAGVLLSDTVLGMTMPQNQHVSYFLEYEERTKTGGFMIDRRYMGQAGMGENYGARPAGVGVDGLILHHTGGAPNGGGFIPSLNWLTGSDSEAGAHYLIHIDGAIYQLVEDRDAAWHAGYSILNGREDCNRYTLGVELVNAGDGNDIYPQVQQDALVWLIREKARQHEFTRAWVETHQKVRADYKARYPNATNPDGSPIGYKTDPRGLNVTAILDRAFSPVVPPPSPDNTVLHQLLLDEAERRIALRFNPTAALQRAIFAGDMEQFTPNSPEFTVTHDNKTYVAQRAENGRGLVRVYFVPVGDWGNIRYAERAA